MFSHLSQPLVNIVCVVMFTSQRCKASCTSSPEEDHLSAPDPILPFACVFSQKKGGKGYSENETMGGKSNQTGNKDFFYSPTDIWQSMDAVTRESVHFIVVVQIFLRRSHCPLLPYS